MTVGLVNVIKKWTKNRLSACTMSSFKTNTWVTNIGRSLMSTPISGINPQSNQGKRLTSRGWLSAFFKCTDLHDNSEMTEPAALLVNAEILLSPVEKYLRPFDIYNAFGRLPVILLTSSRWQLTVTLTCDICAYHAFTSRVHPHMSDLISIVFPLSYYIDNAQFTIASPESISWSHYEIHLKKIHLEIDFRARETSSRLDASSLLIRANERKTDSAGSILPIAHKIHHIRLYSRRPFLASLRKESFARVAEIAIWICTHTPAWFAFDIFRVPRETGLFRKALIHLRTLRYQ